MDLDPRIEGALELLKQSMSENEQKFNEALKQMPEDKRSEYLKILKKAKTGSINMKDLGDQLKDIN